jgi:folate-dependent phosphoribosylglycinamide formyltransferase PurN
VLPGDTPAMLAARIHELEHRHYPEVVASLVAKLLAAGF